MTDIIHGQVADYRWEAVISGWLYRVDRRILFAILALFVLGIIFCSSATLLQAERLDRGEFHYVIRHIFFGTISLVLMLVISFTNLTYARRIGLFVFAVAAVSLVLLPFLGTDYGKGAVRWFSLGPFSIQPSEFLKPGFILCCAWLVAGSMQQGGIPGKTLALGVTTIIVGTLVLQPDFGQSSLIIFGLCAIIFASGYIAPFLLIVGMGGIAGGLAYWTSDHFRGRITAFLEGSDGERSQVYYSLNLYREGGFTGVGIFGGEKKWSLPDSHTDFTLSVVAEENGLLLGVFPVIALYMYIFLRSIDLVKKVKDNFLRLAVVGLVSMIAVQAFIHAAVTVNLIPAKGLTLPFVSYGGSSMLATGLTFGLLLAFLRHASEESDGKGHMNYGSVR